MYLHTVRPEHGPGWVVKTGTYNYWLWAPRPAKFAGDGQNGDILLPARTKWTATWERVDQTNGGVGYGDDAEEAFANADWPTFKGARQARRDLAAEAELFLTFKAGA